MANVCETQSTNMADSETPDRVKCANSKVLESIRDAVSSAFTNVLSKSKSLSEEQRQRCIERFQAIYENALSQTIELRGQLWNGRITTNGDVSGTESTSSARSCTESTERVEYFYDNVLPRLEDAMVGVTRKRKTYPKRCVEHLKKKLKLQKEALEKIKVVPSTLPVGSLIAEEDDDALLRLASKTAEDWSRCKQTTESLIEKARKLKEVQMKLKYKTICTSSVPSQNSEEREKIGLQDNFVVALKSLHSCNVTVPKDKHLPYSHRPRKSVLCKIAD